jgi:uncharacterized membrane protein (DUF106 family)
VVTNAIAEYLPDEETGKPSSLPTLVIKLLHVFDYPWTSIHIILFWTFWYLIGSRHSLWLFLSCLVFF